MEKNNVYLVQARLLDMGQGEVIQWKNAHAENIEKAIKFIYETYLTIEILSIEKVGEREVK